MTEVIGAQEARTEYIMGRCVVGGLTEKECPVMGRVKERRFVEVRA